MLSSAVDAIARLSFAVVRLPQLRGQIKVPLWSAPLNSLTNINNLSL